MSRLAPFGLMKALYRILLGWSQQGRFSGGARLGLLLLTAIIFSFWVAAGQVEAHMLFQSPLSPVFESAIAPPPVEQAPIEQAAPLQSPVTQPPAEQAAPVESAPGAPPPVVDPNAPPPVVDPNAPPPAAEPVRRDSEDTPLEETDNEDPSNFILDQAEFIDTVVVSGAYIWLCCGVSLFLLVPLVLLFVYIRGRSKIIREEGY